MRRVFNPLKLKIVFELFSNFYSQRNNNYRPRNDFKAKKKMFPSIKNTKKKSFHPLEIWNIFNSIE